MNNNTKLTFLIAFIALCLICGSAWGAQPGNNSTLGGPVSADATIKSCPEGKRSCAGVDCCNDDEMCGGKAKGCVPKPNSAGEAAETQSVNP